MTFSAYQCKWTKRNGAPFTRNETLKQHEPLTIEETAPAVSDLPHCATTEEYMAYQMGFAAGQKEYRELPESSIRTMHAAMRQSLARPASYPTGITGTDRAHLQGRCDAYGYYLNNRPEPTYAIRSRRTGVWLRQGAIGFADQMAAIKWAKDYANDYQVIVTIHHGTDGPVCVTVIPD